MTIVAATRDSRGNVYMASDTLLTDGDMRAGHAQKFVWGNNGRIMGMAGYMRTQNILSTFAPLIFEQLNQTIKESKDTDTEVFFMADIIAQYLNDNGYTPGSVNPTTPDAGPKGMDLEAIYITNGRIYDIDKSLSYVEHPEFYAIGCAKDIAVGAFLAAKHVHPLYGLIKAAQAAIEMNTACGGTIDLNIITPSKLEGDECDAFVEQLFADAGLQDVQEELEIYVRSFT